MVTRRVITVLMATVLGCVGLIPPATATATVQLSATITNTDGLDQDGSVCLELVGSGTCGGTNFTAGHWAYSWSDADFEPGNYLIRVVSSTMAGTSRWYVAGDQAGTTVKGLATEVTLGQGEPDLDFTMVMPAIATMTGRVVDTDGVGVAGLSVGINQQGMGRSTTTKVDGTYDFSYTRAGTTQVYAQGGADYGNAQTEVVVPTSGPFVVDALVVQRKSSIGGLVTDAVTGEPIPYLEVFAWSATEPRTYLGDDVTDQQGLYAIEGLGGTPFVLRFTDNFDGYIRTLNDAGDPVDWTPQTPIVLDEAEARVYDQALSLREPAAVPAHTLAGTVRDAQSHPVPGIDVVHGDLVATTDRFGRWWLDAPDGTHPLEFVQQPGWDTVFAGEPGWARESFPGRLVSATATPVTVSGGVGADGLDITLVRAVTNLTPPVVGGTTAAVGQILTATPGTWLAPPGATYSIQWLRGNAVVGSGETYLVRSADAGRVLRARETGVLGLATTRALSAPRLVSRVATTTTARGGSASPGVVRLRVRVSADVGVLASGRLLIRRGSAVLKRAVPLIRGRATVLLRRQPSGRQRYVVSYRGAVATAPSTARLPIRVR